MGKEKAIVLAAITAFIVYGASVGAVSNPFGYDLYDDIHRTDSSQQQSQQADITVEEVEEVVPIKTAKDFYSFVPFSDLFVDSIDSKNVYYPNPTIKSAIYRYKLGNYTGALQELYAYVKLNEKTKNDPYAYYYMALAYSKIGETKAAENCFQKVINCNVQGKFLELALKGRDCLTGGEYCKTPLYPERKAPVVVETYTDPLDKFINAPYSGHGFTPELEKEYTQKQLDVLQKSINRKDSLDASDYENLNNIKKK